MYFADRMPLLVMSHVILTITAVLRFLI